MTTMEIKKIIADTVESLQTLSGRPCGTITDDTTPIGDLVGFDSLNGIEATVMIEAALGKTLKTENLLVAEIGGRKSPLTIAQAAEQLQKLLGEMAA
jgi:acyl carrier protein